MDKGPLKKIKRADQNTTLTISLSKDLRARIDQAAEEDRRKVSPWVVIQLERILDDMDAVEMVQPLKVADDPPAKYQVRARKAGKK